MQTGKVLVAQHQGTYVIKLVGDVRLTLCATIDDYLAEMFASPHFVGVIADLSEADGIDSTSLGLLAKLAIKTRQTHQLVPIIVSPNPNITRLLDSMGFQKVFDIQPTIDQPVVDKTGEHQLGELPVVCANENCVREKVIEAHRTLMGMNAQNRQAFSALVSTLEAC
jgi:anti-anti-sigma factor